MAAVSDSSDAGATARADALTVIVQAPAAVELLMADDPRESLLDRLFRMDRSPFAADHRARVISERPENGAVSSSEWVRFRSVPDPLARPIPDLAFGSDKPGMSSPGSGPASSGATCASLGNLRLDDQRLFLFRLGRLQRERGRIGRFRQRERVARVVRIHQGGDVVGQLLGEVPLKGRRAIPLPECVKVQGQQKDHQPVQQQARAPRRHPDQKRRRPPVSLASSRR